MQNLANLGGQIFEGLLYRKGTIVKNWKFRWFLLSPTQGEVSSDPAVCTGSMSVLLVMSNLCILVLHGTNAQGKVIQPGLELNSVHVPIEFSSSILYTRVEEL